MTWEDEVHELYTRSDMDTDEFALRGERPDHPDLPLFLPLPLDEVSE